MDRRIWIDLADDPSDETQFRFHVTTSNQPFGFQRYTPNSKLPLSERRNARYAYEKSSSPTTSQLGKADERTAFRVSKPWESLFPLDLIDLIRVFKEDATGLEPFVSEQLEVTKAAMLASLQILEANTPAVAHIERRIKRLEEPALNIKIQVRLARLSMALKRLFEFRIPLIEVPPDHFEDKGLYEQADPPLAVLFKRIGTGGTPLSDADYVYSVIKHRLPESYVLVEALSQQPNIGGLLSAPDIVMTAVRLSAADCALPDRESPSKADFHQLQFNDEFLDKFKHLISDGGRLHIGISALTKTITYEGEHDCGLPKHALSLLNRPLIQVLLRWVLPLCDQHPATLQEHLLRNRAEILRFIMYWVLCVTDPRKASMLLFKEMKQQTGVDFMGNNFAHILQNNQIAIPLINPDELREMGNIVFSPSNVDGLRGWKRFHIEPDSSEFQRSCASLYSRWWSLRGSHVHPLLLWLQRSLVDQFDGYPAAGRDEETPYDYDHICPSNHWYGWQGVGGENRLIDFHNDKSDEQGHWRLGNSIGNVRVWDSSDNRSLGDASPRDKLPLEPGSRLDMALLSQSLIDKDEISDWLLCSGGDDVQFWTKERALAFQRAIERRAFNLYQNFYQDLGFGNGYTSDRAA